MVFKETAKKYLITNLYKGKLKKSGKQLVGLCPFHKETAPSFSIYPDTNTFYCFSGCGFGDVIKFYEKLHNVSFMEAVKQINKLQK